MLDAPKNLLPEVHRLTSSRNTPSSGRERCGDLIERVQPARAGGHVDLQEVRGICYNDTQCIELSKS